MVPEQSVVDARRIVIAGAAGRDFHNFNTAFRDDPTHRVVAFTATQIPGISGRRYPASLAGDEYPDGIAIVAEDELEDVCRKERVDEVVFAYSDVTHPEVMHLASRALAVGCDFRLMGTASTMLASPLMTIAVSAVRTGCGKSQTARYLAQHLLEKGRKPAVLRHPMPYGDLERQRCQRFASRADIDAANCTNEECEEYELYVDAGCVIYAGIDYAEILRSAEQESDVVLWDGGNNDFPFVVPDLHIVLVDALRPDQITTHHPGEAVVRMADIVVVSKADAATPGDLQQAIDGVRAVNPAARILRANSPVVLDDPEALRGRKVIVVDDGPTLTHGGMRYGAGYVAAVSARAEILDPRESAPATIRAVFDEFPHIGRVVPAVGYDADQREALRRTLEESAADVIVSGTPFDLAEQLGISKTVVRARYEFEEAEDPGLAAFVDECLAGPRRRNLRYKP